MDQKNETIMDLESNSDFENKFKIGSQEIQKFSFAKKSLPVRSKKSIKDYQISGV